MSFLEELKRRKVFRVAASYAVVAFIIMQLVDIVFPIFDFPQWTSQFVIILVFFALSFYTVYTNCTTTPEAMQLFNFLFFIWGLYGVAAIMSVNVKNFMYNLLDIVSKNFYGLFIFYKIMQVAK